MGDKRLNDNAVTGEPVGLLCSIFLDRRRSLASGCRV